MRAQSTPPEARRAVQKLKDAGAGFIMVYWNISPEAYYSRYRLIDSWKSTSDVKEA